MAQKLKWSVDPALLQTWPLPPPMHSVAPRTLLGNSWWRKTKLAAYESTEYHCKACGVHRDKAKSRKWLEAHECYSVNYLKARLTYIQTVPLCVYCHNYIHRGRLDYLLRSGKIHQSKYVAIVQHGDKVLANVGLVRLTPEEMEHKLLQLYNSSKTNIVPAWEDWRMVIDGKEYHPKYKTRMQWEAAFRK